MKPRAKFELPPEVEEKFRYAVRLEWISFALMFSCVVLVYFTLGQSQAMKAIFIEDVLALIPPIAFLVAARLRWKAPNERFPYGYHHAVSIGFLTSAIALVALGLLVLFEAAKTLLTRQHPTVGVIGLFGHQIWIGWLTYPVLLYCMACEFTMGKIKTPVAAELHDKALAADARMNRADWLSGASAMVGMAGIALGWWWADALAAMVIAFEIVRDGVGNLHDALSDLMDEVPTKADESETEDWETKLRQRIKALAWVRDADVRLREEGSVFSGEVFVVPYSTDDLTKRNEEVQKLARELDWRFYELCLVAVEKLGS